MKSINKKRKIKYNNILIFGIILIFIVFIIILYSNRDKNIYMIDITNKNIDVVYELLDDYQLDIDISYEFNDDVLKDNVISQSIKVDSAINIGDKLSLVVSRGILDKEKLKKDGINELGKVPIMMYHGIKDIKSSDTDYIGGNVDKDGYTRTAEAFRNDLET